MGASGILLRYLQTVYSESQNRLKWMVNFSKFSGILFNIYIDELTKFVSNGRITTIVLGAKPVFLLKYAEDIVLLSPTDRHLQQSLNRLG